MKIKRLLWLVGILFLLTLAMQAGLDEVKLALGQAEVEIMILLALLQLCTLSLNSYQWFYLLNNKQKRISHLDTFAIYLSGGFIESVTPSSKLGGEAAKIYLFSKESGLNYQELTARMIVHKYISLLPFLILAVIALFFAAIGFNLPRFVYLAVLIFLLGFLSFYYYWQIKDETEVEKDLSLKQGLIKDKLAKGKKFLNQALAKSKELLKPKELNFLLLISLFVWALYPVKLYLVSQMIGADVSFILIVIITYAAYLVSILPLSPGGLGTFEASVALIFSLNGFSFALGLSVALLSRLITYWLPLLLSALAALYIISTKDLNIFNFKAESKMSSGGEK